MASVETPLHCLSWDAKKKSSQKNEWALRISNLFLFLVKFFTRPKRTWSKADYESESDDSEFLKSDLATVECRVVKGLFDHELELFVTKINLLVKMALEFVDGGD